ncbi:hypothetical protein GCM10010145_29640 [Streptomyces ruber]|uniref:Chaplin domain-containing protein n=2 Tax=Streptomyces TaxID=1883 RepID=A0A918BBQ1_9ACTN|nr:chaplin [Streptomyces ruber]GGQ57804.1 hypothetical protein GCM10010145_29640 [Streptomyces ruber]
MRQVTRKSLMTVAAATGVIAATGGHASADSGAQGSASHSPGVLAGNSVQVPVHAPVDACGNTVSVVGAFSPSTGNRCTQRSDGAHEDGHGRGQGAEARTADSAGIGSGNSVRVSVDAPVDVCGNSVNAVAVDDPATGNECGDGFDGNRRTPPGGGHGNSPGDGRGNQVGDRGRPADPGAPGSAGGAGRSGGSEGADRSDEPGSSGDGAEGGEGGESGDGAFPEDPGIGIGPSAAGDAEVTDEHEHGLPGDSGTGGREQAGGRGGPGGPGTPSGTGTPHGAAAGGPEHEPFRDLGHPVAEAPSVEEPGAEDPGGVVPRGAGGDGEARAAAFGAGAVVPGGSRGSATDAPAVTRPRGAAQLARTGGGLPPGPVIPMSAGTLLGGALLYRKARAAM